jgi:hypothetical protein
MNNIVQITRDDNPCSGVTIWPDEAELKTFEDNGKIWILAHGNHDYVTMSPRQFKDIFGWVPDRASKGRYMLYADLMREGFLVENRE